MAKCEKMKETGTLVQEISKQSSAQCAQAASSGKALEATGTQRTRSPEHFCRYLIGSLDLGTAKRTTNSEMLHGIKGGKQLSSFSRKEAKKSAVHPISRGRERLI